MASDSVSGTLMEKVKHVRGAVLRLPYLVLNSTFLSVPSNLPCRCTRVKAKKLTSIQQ